MLDRRQQAGSNLQDTPADGSVANTRLAVKSFNLNTMLIFPAATSLGLRR
jgi:hypothetical protein